MILNKSGTSLGLLGPQCPSEPLAKQPLLFSITRPFLSTGVRCDDSIWDLDWGISLSQRHHVVITVFALSLRNEDLSSWDDLFLKAPGQALLVQKTVGNMYKLHKVMQGTDLRNSPLNSISSPVDLWLKKTFKVGKNLINVLEVEYSYINVRDYISPVEQAKTTSSSWYPTYGYL